MLASWRVIVALNAALAGFRAPVARPDLVL
jgi:hypothetical protein